MSIEPRPMKITFLGCGTTIPKLPQFHHPNNPPPTLGKLNSAILQGILTSLETTNLSDFQPPFNIPSITNTYSIPDPPIITPTSLTACVHHESSAASLTRKFSNHHTVTVLAGQNVLGVQQGEIIILGVEPSVYRTVLAEQGMLEALRGKVLVSIVGGVSVSKLYEAIFHHPSSSSSPPIPPAEQSSHCHIMRVTPGISASVRESVSLISEEPERERRHPPSILSAVYSLFLRVGQVKLWPEKLQAAGATITAGSLAFLSVALEGLVESAVREGIEKGEAFQMAASCMMGLAKLITSGETPGGVREKVATPGGEFGNSIYIYIYIYLE